MAFLLDAAQIATVEAEMKELCEADQTTVDWYRPTTANDPVYGKYEPTWPAMGTVTGEWNWVLPNTPVEIGGDAYFDVPHDCTVQEQDVLKREGIYYRVRPVHPYRLFGAHTHQRLELEKLEPQP